MDLFRCFWNPQDGWIFSLCPKDAVACIIEIGGSSGIPLVVFGFSVEWFHRAVREPCIVGFKILWSFSWNFGYCKRKCDFFWYNWNMDTKEKISYTPLEKIKKSHFQRSRSKRSQKKPKSLNKLFIIILKIRKLSSNISMSTSSFLTLMRQFFQFLFSKAIYDRWSEWKNMDPLWSKHWWSKDKTV